MAKVRFLQDYRGWLTAERFYRKGDVLDVPHPARLLAAGRVELVAEEPEPEPVAVDLETLTRDELREMAKEAGVDQYYKLSKAKLVKALKG